MKITDLKSLAEKVTNYTTQNDLERHYGKFIERMRQILQQQNRQISSGDVRDKLYENLRKFDELKFNYSERKIIELLEYGKILGSQACSELDSILLEENFDPGGALKKLEQKLSEFQGLIRTLGQISQHLSKVPAYNEIALSENERLLEITFLEEASISHIVDFEKWIDAWNKIIRAFSLLHGEKPEDARIVFVQKSSPLIVDIAGLYAVVYSLSKAVDMVLEKVERYLRIRKEIESIKNLKLQNKRIEKDLEEEAEKYIESATAEIVDVVKKEKKKGVQDDIASSLTNAVSQLFKFVHAGGRIDCPDSSKDEDLGTVVEKVRMLQESIDKMKYLESQQVGMRRRKDKSQ